MICMCTCKCNEKSAKGMIKVILIVDAGKRFNVPCHKFCNMDIMPGQIQIELK